MFKSITLNKFVSVGLLSVFLFAFSFSVVGAQATGDVTPELTGVEDFT